MKGLIANIERFTWSIVWVFMIIIAGYWLLAFTRHQFGSSLLGSLAQGIQNRAQPQA